MAVQDDDIFLVSYPRSGNRGIRFLVANLLSTGEPVTFANPERAIPDLYLHSKRYFRRLPRPRVIKSHEYFDPRYRKVVYVVRDPRDVTVSSYYFQLKERQIEPDCWLDGYVDRFARGEVWSAYGSWGEHVGSWLASKGMLDEVPPDPKESGFLMLRYEGILNAPAAALEKLSHFLDTRVDERRLSEVAHCSLERMKQLEKQERRSGILTRNTRADVSFVRGAGSGDWRRTMSDADARKIETMWTPLMRKLGTARNWTPPAAPIGTRSLHRIETAK